jgi:hypothetical protein
MPTTVTGEVRRRPSAVPGLLRRPGHRRAERLPADRPEGGSRHDEQFAKVNLFTIDDVSGGPAEAQNTPFADGGVFDQVHARE